uniref:Uncharacterized protein n=1 Tax=Helianthus annuus TaxID=4232 RepID=A0A251S9W0_HELAN
MFELDSIGNLGGSSSSQGGTDRNLGGSSSSQGGMDSCLKGKVTMNNFRMMIKLARGPNTPASAKFLLLY